MEPAAPHYVTLSGGQLRIWRVGQGPDLMALAGPTLSGQVTATQLAALSSGWRITVVELPGIGGSARHSASTIPEIVGAINALVDECGLKPVALVAFELSGVIARAMAQSGSALAARVHCVGADRARGWSRSVPFVPDIAPRQDGGHLTALWSFIRDRHLLRPDDVSLPAKDGEPLPSAGMLDETVVAAGVYPERFAVLWRTLAGEAHDLAVEYDDLRLADLPARLAPHIEGPGGEGKLPAPSALPNAAIWHHYVDTQRGRMHLRRSGSKGRPTLVIPTGGGSSAQFAPVVQGLANGEEKRQVFSVDYLGNGLSDKPDRAPVSIEDLAEDMHALLDAMGHDKVDVWGSHTGALVGLELAVRYPERVGRLVMEGPVFVSPDFQSDLLAHYFLRIAPDHWGLHLPLVWNWRRDMFMYWPWYRLDRDAARTLGVPSAEQLHMYAIGILESGPTYDQAYRSAFTYDTRERLPLLQRPALVCAGPEDMLANALEEAAALAVPGVEIKSTPATVWWPDPEPKAAAEALDIYRTFLDG